MASSRRTATNEAISTFGSAAGRDFSNVAVWEAATDDVLTSGYSQVVISNPSTARHRSGEALSFSSSGATAVCWGTNAARTTMWYKVVSGTPTTDDTITGDTTGATADIDSITSTDTGVSPVLECYADSASYALGGIVSIGGATCSTTYFRILRAASTARHNGVPGAGVKFTNTSYLAISENYSQIQDVEVFVTANSSSDIYAVQSGSGVIGTFIGILASCTNSGTGYGYGFSSIANGCVFVNCVAYGCDGSGFIINAGSTTKCRVLNCAAVGNATYGFTYVTNEPVYLNCIAQDNGTAGWNGSGYTGSDWNLSDDATAPGANSQQSKNLSISVSDFALESTDTDAIDTGTSLSGDAFAFDDDIAFTTRSTWDIGPFEYVATGQFARPASDVADGNWLNQASSNVNLYASIDEETASDADYIRSGSSPSDDTCTVGLSAIETPAPGTVTIRIRARYL